MKDQNELESSVKQRLDEIKPIPPRNPHTASRGRAQFLSQAVSAHELRRQKGWKSKFGKERYAMNMLLSILVVAGLLFGGGMTVSAAQDDLPNEPLYEVKLWTEDLSLQWQNNEEATVNRLMELAQVRIQEMTRLAEAGQPVQDRVRQRLEQHIQQALQICVNMDDPTLERTLLQLRDRLREQDRDMEQLQLRTRDQLQQQSQDQEQLRLQEQEKLEEQIRLMFRERLQLVEEGLNNQEMFRYQVRNGYQYGQDDELTPPVQNQNQEQNQNQNTDEQNGEPNPDPGGNSNDSGGGDPNNNGSGGGGRP